MIKVSCAIIENENEILVAQRGERMSFPLKWEFPGGKIEEGETAEEGIKRELREELSIEIRVKEHLEPVIHHYEKISVELYPMTCELIGGELKAVEHKAIKWVEKHELAHFDWIAADVSIVKTYLEK